jgi:hypothetical protein
LLGPEFLELRIFNVVGRLAQHMCHTCPMPIDFAQHCVSACFCAHDQAIDTLDLVDLERQLRAPNLVSRNMPPF